MQFEKPESEKGDRAVPFSVEGRNRKFNGEIGGNGGGGDGQTYLIFKKARVGRLKNKS